MKEAETLYRRSLEADRDQAPIQFRRGRIYLNQYRRALGLDACVEGNQPGAGVDQNRMAERFDDGHPVAQNADLFGHAVHGGVRNPRVDDAGGKVKWMLRHGHSLP